MHLRSVRVEGYKRFSSKQVLYVGQHVVAIVGPNEAGKTSLLTALEHVTKGAGFDRREFSGRAYPNANNEIVSARYAVEQADRRGLEDLLDASTPYMFDLRVLSNGETRWWIEPWVSRDRATRDAVHAALADATETASLRARPDPNEERPEADGDAAPTEPDSELLDAVRGVTEALATADEDLDNDQLEQVAQLGEILAAKRDELVDPEAADQLIAELQDLQHRESQPNPQHRIFAALSARIPPFLLFDQDQMLRSDYPWSEFPIAPAGLANLLYLADADYDRYRELAIDRDRRDELSTYERAANRELKRRLAVWSQHDLTINLRADTESLAVHVTDTDTDRDVLIEERSAGLQMFAAVLAFCARHGDGVAPILLFDEAETHLHYGAQADLVQVFERQTVAQAVIYTTHSVGCLPEDLGRSIRVVAPTGNDTSEIRNEFWSGGVGLTPLTLAMGASALAVLPARYALIAEGPTEAILLPSLLRECRDSRFKDQPLGFQIAPGAAEVSNSAAPDLEAEAGNVAYLFDSDEGGRLHAEKLAQRAWNEGRVFILGDGQEEGLCTEDLVSAPTYVDAINDVLQRTRQTDRRFGSSDLPYTGRGPALEAWCLKHEIQPISKTLVAESVLRVSERSGALVEPTRVALLSRLYRDVRKAVGLR